MNTLVVAEKPSVAQTIAKVVGANEKKDGYISGNGYNVSWCIGHLVGLAEPEAYNPDFRVWKIENLPIVPAEWKYVVSDDKKKQFSVIKSLMNDKDTEKIICATDAGREGELIFRLVYNMAGCKKDFYRLWTSSLEESAIRDGLRDAKSGREYENLYQSAVCRSVADWLVGLNATRLFSTKYRAKLSVGRVQTPTVAMIVEREKAIENFVKQKFYTVFINSGDVEAKSERIDSESDAGKMVDVCNGKNAVCTSYTEEEKTVKPPKLYDLTTAQRECNRIFGYTAKQTLDTIQALYDKRIVTYPRTDSQYITDDMEATIPGLISLVLTKIPLSEACAAEPNTKIIVNNAKVSDHTALLPTKELGNTDIEKLPEVEQNILKLICSRLLQATAPNYVYFDVRAILSCEGYNFTARGKTAKIDGFKAIEKAFKQYMKMKEEKTDGTDETDRTLPKINEGQTFEGVKSSKKESFTSPPKRYTEDTLLSAMENAGNADYAENEDVEKKGIGTPATRASIIEKIISTEYVSREKKQLIPTEKGINLICLLPETIVSPKLTADWETELQKIERGEKAPETFKKDIIQYTGDIIKQFAPDGTEKASDNPFYKPKEKNSIGKCPRCKSDVYESDKNFYCSNKDCKFSMWKNDKFFENKKTKLTTKQAMELLAMGKTYFPKLFSETKQKEYSATVTLSDTGIYVNYKLDFTKPDPPKLKEPVKAQKANKGK